jgi:hypothetical protein
MKRAGTAAGGAAAATAAMLGAAHDAERALVEGEDRGSPPRSPGRRSAAGSPSAANRARPGEPDDPADRTLSAALKTQYESRLSLLEAELIKTASELGTARARAAALEVNGGGGAGGVPPGAQGAGMVPFPFPMPMGLMNPAAMQQMMAAWGGGGGGTGQAVDGSAAGFGLATDTQPQPQPTASSPSKTSAQAGQRGTMAEVQQVPHVRLLLHVSSSTICPLPTVHPPRSYPMYCLLLFLAPSHLHSH